MRLKRSSRLNDEQSKIINMAGTRYGHKLKARLNNGNKHLFTKKGNVKTNYQIISPEGYISMAELADAFFTTVEKIKKARRVGIIEHVDIEQNHVGAKAYFSNEIKQ